MYKNQFTGSATEPQRNRKLCQFNNDQYCNNTNMSAKDKIQHIDIEQARYSNKQVHVIKLPVLEL